MGKNNSGVGVGGSMTHFAGYVPRLHPSDFEVRTRDGVAVDWPISYEELKPSFERVERELPVAGQDWPWGDPHTYPHAPHPISGAAAVAWRGAEDCGIEMRVGPVSITNGRFGNRPHCIYRGLLPAGLQGQRQGQPAHHPSARRDRARRRGPRQRDGGPRRDRRGQRPRHRRHLRQRRRHALRRAPTPSRSAATRSRPRACCCTPPAAASPTGWATHNDQVGRYVMVQGATQVAGALPRGPAHVQGAAPRGLQRAVLRDRREPRLCPRVLDPDRLAAAHRLGRARPGRRPLGPRAARVHARLQPLERPRRPVRAAPPGRQPRHPRRRDRRVRNAGGEVHALDVRQRPRQHRLRHPDDAAHLGARRRPGHAHHRPLRPPRRRRAHGLLRRGQRDRLLAPRLGG